MHPSLLQSDKTDWQTPPWFIELVNRVGPIALDPATSSDNPTGAAEFMCPENGQDGLTHPWREQGLVFCNPPYGRALSDKGGWSYRMAAHEGEGIYLVPSRTETAWWRRLYAWSDWVLLWSSRTHGSRIRFVRPGADRQPTGNTFPSSVFYRGPRSARFMSAFGQHGTLVPGKRTKEALIKASVSLL